MKSYTSEGLIELQSKLMLVTGKDETRSQEVESFVEVMIVKLMRLCKSDFNSGKYMLIYKPLKQLDSVKEAEINQCSLSSKRKCVYQFYYYRNTME